MEGAWIERPIVWLTGVRRSGKTTLAKSLPNVRYFDCELPRTRAQLSDPEGFLEQHRGERIVLDEVHRLPNPSELLKIAADHFPDIRLLATGSSTLGASARFRDTLTGRKRHLHLAPVLFREFRNFGIRDVRRRLFHGGLPENLRASEFPEADFAEWLDAYWARDVQEMFRLEKRDSFLRLLELLLVQSGGLCELSSLTSPCGASRQTISNYLRVLGETGVVHILRPFSKRPDQEIRSMPKVYGFDTGFVCFARGWRELRQEDLGALWEHLVLDELRGWFRPDEIQYWQDKQKREIDFVIARRGRPPIAIECKWRAQAWKPRAWKAFRSGYPDARAILVASDCGEPFRRKVGESQIVEAGLGELSDAIRLVESGA